MIRFSAFLLAALLVASLGGCVQQRTAPITTIRLDDVDRGRAYECMNQGFAIKVWTDGMHTRVECAAAY